MDGADEIIPGMARGEVADPVLVAGQIIHFQRQADGELRKFLLGQPDLGDVFIELASEHPPVVEIIALHGRMIGEPNFRQAEFHGAAGIFHRFACRVTTERRVHVIIGRQRHAPVLRVES